MTKELIKICWIVNPIPSILESVSADTARQKATNQTKQYKAFLQDSENNCKETP